MVASCQRPPAFPCQTTENCCHHVDIRFLAWRPFWLLPVNVDGSLHLAGRRCYQKETSTPFGELSFITFLIFICF